MLVRFATICDLCNARSAEYKQWPSCEVCIRDVCPSCRHKDCAGVDDPVICNRCDPKHRPVRVHVLLYPSHTLIDATYVTLEAAEEEPFFRTLIGYCVFDNDLKRWRERRN